MRFKVSLAQINPKTGDIRANGKKIVEAIRTARGRGADLVVLPEMCLTGYCLDEKLLINLEFLRANRRCLMEEIRPACRDISAIVRLHRFRRRSAGSRREGGPSQRSGCREPWKDPSGRPQEAAARLSLLRRQTLLRPGRGSGAGHHSRGEGKAFPSAC